jgi:hypothetical protein
MEERVLTQDVMRTAARRGLPSAGPRGDPFNPLFPLCMLSAVDRDDIRLRLAMAWLAACRERGGDIAGPPWRGTSPARPAAMAPP